MFHNTTPLLVPETLIYPVLYPRILIIPILGQLRMVYGIPKHIVILLLFYTVSFSYFCLASKPVARIFRKYPKELIAISPKKALLIIYNILAKLIQDLVKSITNN
jgi:hypothetical protein